MTKLGNFINTIFLAYSFIWIFKRIGAYKENKLFCESKLVILIAIVDTILFNRTIECLSLGVYYFTLAIGIYLIYKRNIYNFFKSYLLTFCLIHLSDLVVGYIFYKYTNILDTYSFENILFIEIVIFLLANLICNLIKKIRFFSEQINLDIDEIKILWIYVLLIIILNGFLVYSFKINPNLNKYIFIYPTIFVIGIIISSILFFILNKNHIEKKEIQIYNRMIEESLDNMKVFKHDYKNILAGIQGFLETNDIDGLKNYFYENLVKNKVLSTELLYNLINIKNIPVKGLMNIKASKAISKGIELNINIVNPIEKFVLKDIDICKIIGILFDNAIESSEESVQKILNIGILGDEDEICIIISNSFKIKPEISKIFRKGYSTKGNNRGLGLNTIRKLNKKYPNISIYTFIKEDLFNQELTIKR